MSRKIITQSITNKEFTDKFINFSEIALWSYTLNDNFIKGDDFLKFIDCIFNSQLTYANEAYLKFVNIKSFDLTRIIEAENNLKILNRNLEERVKDRTKELINLNKEKDNILLMVSHDLK